MSNCGFACAGNAGNVFPATAGKQYRHASRHVHDARAVMHAGIANSLFLLNSAAEENVPGIPGACATHNFTYLVRDPWVRLLPGIPVSKSMDIPWATGPSKWPIYPCTQTLGPLALDHPMVIYKGRREPWPLLTQGPGALVQRCKPPPAHMVRTIKATIGSGHVFHLCLRTFCDKKVYDRSQLRQIGFLSSS